ncbi:ribosome maturation factor RimP [Agarilytica rhodophyticola]|uniref:ribosome maturation factor RimP n=1 Tax=Agarilytica rhodophyticola TaxID=1737490 RepID=UPI000B346547|nr:ribosome maturation factor RimP [Agarilytica rhodophyticola]
MAGIQAKLEKIVESAITALGCELWGLDYFVQGKKTLLRIYIDKPGGVVIEDCEAVSRQISSVLDVEDPIAAEYTLEVSSPGMDRRLYKLTQYDEFIGQKLTVKLRMGFEGRKNFTGILKGIEEDEVVLEVDNEEYLLPYELIDKANVVPTY